MWRERRVAARRRRREGRETGPAISLLRTVVPRLRLADGLGDFGRERAGCMHVGFVLGDAIEDRQELIDGDETLALVGGSQEFDGMHDAEMIVLGAAFEVVAML